AAGPTGVSRATRSYAAPAASNTCFFFQAEDGIRDGHVTGVQTCALPIWKRPSSLARNVAPIPSGESPDGTGGSPVLPRTVFQTRSEERRVGKECRNAVAPYRRKEKEKREG